MDQPALKPLPIEPYTYAAWEQQRAGLDYHLKIEGHHYSVPHQLVRKKLWARITTRTVEIFDNGKRVATHMRSSSEGGQTVLKEHMPSARHAGSVQGTTALRRLDT